MAYRILIVDDEAALQNMVKEILTQAGYETASALTCAQALEQFQILPPDAVLLDVNLPDGDGFSLLGKLRENRDVPVLFLSARDEDADRLQGLGLGADDYITKPFLPQELLLRLHAVLRRVYREETQAARLGDAEIDWGKSAVRRNGAETALTAKEFILLKKLWDARGNIVTIDFADPANPIVEPVKVDFSQAGLALCILDSGADHADLTDEYAAIPNDCRAVAKVCGGEVLRDVPFETFMAKLPECRAACGDRAVLRALHVYADNQRVVKQVAALRAGDFDTFLALVNESGLSSWEYLQNVIPAGYKEHQEVAVTIAAAKQLLGGRGAVRVHGGGFAGTAQAFVPLDMLDEFKTGIERIIGEGRCHVLSIRPEGGAVL